MAEKENHNTGKLEMIAAQKFPTYDEMYKVVDFLNRSLKDRNILFGLTKSENAMHLSIYEVE